MLKNLIQQTELRTRNRTRHTNQIKKIDLQNLNSIVLSQQKHSKTKYQWVRYDTFPWLEGQSPNHLKLKPERSDSKFQAAVTAGPSIFLVKHYNQQKFN